MTRCYEPPPAKAPLLRRRPGWAGGLPVWSLILTAVLALPAVRAGVLLVWAFDGLLRP